MKFSGKSKKTFNNKKKTYNSKNGEKTRKEIRKEQRQKKKSAKVKSYLKNIKKTNEYHNTEKGKPKKVQNKDGLVVKTKINQPEKSKVKSHKHKDGIMTTKTNQSKQRLTDLSRENMKSKNELQDLEDEMKEQRKQLLIEANKKEDAIISKLEKQLKLSRRKSKSLPSSFTSAGFDYILDVCNPEKMKNLAEGEKYMQDSGSEFEDDLAVVKGKSNKSESDDELSDSDNDAIENSDNQSGDDSLLGDLEGDDESDDDFDNDDDDFNESDEDLNSMDELTESNTLKNSKTNKLNKRPVSDSDSEPPVEMPSRKNSKSKKKVKLNVDNAPEDSDKGVGKFVTLHKNNKPSEVVDSDTDLDGQDNLDENSLSENESLNDEEADGEETWEDIYGRTRDKEGNVVEPNKSKYIPPALRAKSLSGDAKKKETLERLKRQLKGLLNRLAESNMHGIANQIEELYMKNSRHDMNETMISLFEEAIVSPVHTPERLIMEHAMLTAILHANIGTEVGAFVLQTFVTKFDSLLKDGLEVGDKRLDNLLAFICHLYTFKVFDNALLYDILGVLCDGFKEKDIELILVVLRNSGFSLRKDDPLALKELVLRIQRLASQASQLKNDSRVKFMLDVVLKIKNNNMSKLPQYDPSHSEHLKKLIKSMIRKGSYITELKISLQDLLKADERGRWWIVGSAWTGSGNAEKGAKEDNSANNLPLTANMSQQLVDLAKKLRINTDIRKNIFCILMTAEDYEDACEKLLKLGLKGQNMNEIMHVVLHCLLQEKEYNHYYALIANRFSQIDRKYRMVVQYSLWDKFKEVDAMKPFQITNLAKFLAFILLEGTLPLSVLKVIQLVEMTKGNVRFIRQILLTILYHKDETISSAVFLRVNKSTKLHMFREGLRLFLHHFLLKNVKETDEHYDFLKERINLADKALAPQSF